MVNYGVYNKLQYTMLKNDVELYVLILDILLISNMCCKVKKERYGTFSLDMFKGWEVYMQICASI